MKERRNQRWKLKGFSAHGQDFDGEEIGEEGKTEKKLQWGAIYDLRRATTERKERGSHYSEFVTDPLLPTAKN